MSRLVAALPMYDWPERRAEVDAEWAGVRDRLRSRGIDAPEHLTRRNGDLPPVPGGIRDAEGRVIAPDPATLPPDELNIPTMWRHPALLFSQTCWGPLETTDLAAHVRILAQPDYSAFEGGEGENYRSAIVVRAAETLPSGLASLRGLRFAFNDAHSMSGYHCLARDLVAAGEIADVGAMASFWASMHETGAHRASIRAIAEGRADTAVIDCRSWAYARRFEPAAQSLAIVGWTTRRKGLPFITSRHSALASL